MALATADIHVKIDPKIKKRFRRGAKRNWNHNVRLN